MRPKIPALLTAALFAALIIPTISHAAMTSMRAPLFGAADEAMAAADALNARALAPIGYAEAVSQYERADDTFKRAGSVDSIRRYLAKAEAKFISSSEAAEIAAQALEAMIRARADALQTDTASFAPKEWKDGERAFGQATKSLERGNMQSAERYSDKAEQAYRDGELIAIKANYLNETRDFIAMAKKLKADRYAPTSLGNALALLDAAETELNNNRYDTDKPRSLQCILLAM